ncbi:MAG: PepSY domain-containing protein [Planctomycetaceae bacterium]|jgi:uncharacterized iron-regulated membrane protein|nr:PepSY domain-containing protein [Planctomycetaceae bacterium]
MELLAELAFLNLPAFYGGVKNKNAASFVLGDKFSENECRVLKKSTPSKITLNRWRNDRTSKSIDAGTRQNNVIDSTNKEHAMVIQKGRTSFFALSIKDKTQWDMYCGTVIPVVERYGKTLEVERFADKPLGAKIAASIRSLHFGDITGMSSKILFFIR